MNGLIARIKCVGTWTIDSIRLAVVGGRLQDQRMQSVRDIVIGLVTDTGCPVGQFDWSRCVTF